MTRMHLNKLELPRYIAPSGFGLGSMLIQPSWFQNIHKHFTIMARAIESRCIILHRE